MTEQADFHALKTNFLAAFGAAIERAQAKLKGPISNWMSPVTQIEYENCGVVQEVLSKPSDEPLDFEPLTVNGIPIKASVFIKPGILIFIASQHRGGVMTAEVPVLNDWTGVWQ